MTAPSIGHVLETSLYVDDLARAKNFYLQTLGLPLLISDQRMCAFAAGRTVLLLFERGASNQRVILPGGEIPPHDGHGPLHVAFAIGRSDLPVWEHKLDHSGVLIEGRVHWPLGGQSIYFRDPDGHLLEFATPGLWANY